MRFTWMGGPSFRFETGGFTVAGDPVFAATVDSPPSTRTGNPPQANLSGVDAILLTCARGDHLDPALAEHAGADVPVIVPASAVESARAAGIVNARPLAWHEELRLEKARATLTVRAVPARSPSGDDNGYHLLHQAGDATYTAYCTGDAMWSEDIRQIQQELGYVNLLIQHLGAEKEGDTLTSPNAREAMQFVYRMQPNAIVAVHHSTFSHYTEPVAPFAESLGRTIYDKRFHLLAEGESLEK